VDDVAAVIGEAEGFNAEDGLGGAPEFREGDFAAGFKSGRGLGEGGVEAREDGGLAAPLKREFVRAGVRARGFEEVAERGEARGPIGGREEEVAPLFNGGDGIELAEEALGAGAGLAFVAEEEGAEFAESGVGSLLADVEIEAVGGVEIGKAGREAQDGEGASVVPIGEQGIDGAAEKSHDGMAFERRIEIEAGGDAEALEGGAEDG
jgi:hypothetical protein